jgi:hypothetical protein
MRETELLKFPLLPQVTVSDNSQHFSLDDHRIAQATGSTCFWASWIRIRILLSSCKNSIKKTHDSYYFVTLFDFLTLKNVVNVASKSNKQKKLC